jgi:hypothetical protein
MQLMMWLLASGALMVQIVDNDDDMDGDGDKPVKC